MLSDDRYRHGRMEDGDHLDPMMFSSLTKVTLSSAEGVTAFLRKPIARRRFELDQQLAGPIARRAELAQGFEQASKQMTKHQQDLKAEGLREQEQVKIQAELSHLVREQLQALNELAALDEQEFKPAYLRHMVLKLDGAKDEDGHPVTVEFIIQNGPQEVIDELYAAVKKELGLTVDEQGESQPPSTSTAPEGGETSGTTATDAGKPVTTETGIA